VYIPHIYYTVSRVCKSHQGIKIKPTGQANGRTTTNAYKCGHLLHLVLMFSASQLRNDLTD